MTNQLPKYDFTAMASCPTNWKEQGRGISYHFSFGDEELGPDFTGFPELIPFSDYLKAKIEAIILSNPNYGTKITAIKVYREEMINSPSPVVSLREAKDYVEALIEEMITAGKIRAFR